MGDWEWSVWSKDYARLASLAPQSCDVRFRAYDRDVATVQVAVDDEGADTVFTPGARLVGTWHPATGAPITVSGPVEPRPQGPVLSSQLTLQVAGDWPNPLGWPAPASALGETPGTQPAGYWVSSGGSEAAEVVVRALLAANTTRIFPPIALPPATTTLGGLVAAGVDCDPIRFTPVGPAIAQLLTAGHLVFRVWQNGAAGLVGAFSEGVDRTNLALTEAGGQIGDWQVELTPPTVTRVVVGGPGEGTAKTFLTVSDFALEGELGRVLEVFVDGASLTSEQMTAAGVARLAEGAGRVAFTAELVEQPGWTFRDGLELGDLVRVEVVDGVPWTDRITEVRVTSSPRDGDVVTPVVGDGDRANPVRVLTSTLAALRASVQRLQTR